MIQEVLRRAEMKAILLGTKQVEVQMVIQRLAKRYFAREGRGSRQSCWRVGASLGP